MRCWTAVVVAVMGCAAQIAPGDGQPAANPVARADRGTRRIIDTAWLELRVQSIDVVAAQVEQKVSAAQGYVADSQVRPTAHSAHWTVRIPQEKLESFLTTARTWGVVLSSRTTAEDVTEQFIDVEARQRTKRAEESRLLKLLEDGTGNLADVLAVEQQLHRVREEIEQVEGRLRFLENATRYATVHLDAHELFGESWSDGRPLPQQVVSIFRDSCSALLLCGRTAVLVAAALAPWAGVAAIIALPVWGLLRRRKRDEFVKVDVRK